MDTGLLLTPLLPKIFDPDWTFCLGELLELRTVNKFFRDHFLQHERTIYLNHLKVKIGMDLTQLSLPELRLLLARVPELMMAVDPWGCRKVATVEAIAVLNNPQLLSLLPAIPNTNTHKSERFQDLLYYSAKYDNAVAYAEAFKSHRGPYVHDVELRICLRYSALKCFDVLAEHLPYTRKELLCKALKLCHQDGEKYTLALRLTIDYCTNQSSLEELLLDDLGPVTTRVLLKHSSKACNRAAHLELVTWVIDNLSDKAFRRDPLTYLIAAGASSETVDRLASKFLKTPREKLRLKKLFEEHVNRCERKKVLSVTYNMCSSEVFPQVRLTIERAWQ